MGPRLRLIALFLFTALCGLWLLSVRFEEDEPGRSRLADAEPSALEFEPVDPEPSNSPPRIHILEFEYGSGSDERALDPGIDEASEAGAREPDAVSPLPEGSGRIRFSVEDGAGSPAEGAAVALRSLEPGGGAERMDLPPSRRHG